VGRIARWDGSAWFALGAGMNSEVAALTLLPNGDIVAGGTFTTAGGAPANRVARWDGSTWHPLGSGVDLDVWALATLPNGDVVAGGFFFSAGGNPASNIARWDGSTWHALGAGTNSVVEALLVLPNGDLIAGGNFSHAGGVRVDGIARWDGRAWSALGLGPGLVLCLANLPNGDVVAGGRFTMASVGANNIARWDGSGWHAFGSGLGDRARALAVLPDGDLVAGGDFATAGGNVSAYFARLTVACRATAVSFGAGCGGSGPTMRLTATSLPWLGGRFRASCEGMAVSSFGVGLIGANALSIPLDLLHPAGVPGCNLLASPDLLSSPLLPNGGLVTWQIPIPNDPALLSISVRTQILQAELDAMFNLVALKSSNGLTLTLGAY